MPLLTTESLKKFCSFMTSIFSVLVEHPFVVMAGCKLGQTIASGDILEKS